MFEKKSKAFERTHNDILYEYWDHIDSLFTSLDAVTPNINDFVDSPRFRYCQTDHRKDRKKIGYACQLGYHDKYPFVRITVNHFKLGKATFNSAVLDKEKRLSQQNNRGVTNSHPVRHLPTAINDRLRKEKQQQQARLDVLAEQKQATLFQEKLTQWEKASTNIKNHPYAIKKQLVNNNLMRQLGDVLLYPLTHTETGKITCIQTINAKGDKRFFGKQKNTVAVFGDLEKSAVVYLCEGYATANAVLHLASTDKTFSVINTLNCHNLISTALWIKKHYTGKKIVIAADNDQATALKGKGNAGLWYGSKAAMLTQATLLYPHNDKGDNVDWCDSWIDSPDDAKIAFSGAKKIPYKEMALNRLGYASQTTGQSELFSAVRDVFQLFLSDYPLRCNEEDLIAWIETLLMPFAISKNKIKSIWIFVKKQQFAKALRVKTFPLSSVDTAYTVKSYTSMDAIAQDVLFLKNQHPKAIFVTNAPMGTGKTKTLMMPQFKADETAGHHPIMVTPTQALTKNVAEVFQTAHYQKERDCLTDKKGLAITINSIIQEPFAFFLEKCQSVFIDEYTQILRSITSGTVKPMHRQKTHQQLSDLIKKSQYVYIADADLNTIALNDLIQSTEEGTPVFVMTLEKVEQQTPYTLYPCSPIQGKITTLHLLSEAMDKKEPCYVVADSRKKINVLTEYLKEEGVTPLVISSDSIKTQAVQAFLHQPDNYLRQEKPLVVIVSPAIQSGLSIESDYFKRVVGVYTGTVSPAVLSQMLNRVRKPVLREVIITENRGKTFGNESSDALLSESYSHYMQQFGVQHTYFDKQTGVTHMGHLSLKQTEKGLLIQGDPLFERFERLSAELKALENQQKNQSSAFFALQLMAEGVTMDIKTAVLDEKIKALLSFKEAKAENTAIEERYNAVCGDSTLSTAHYRQLKASEINTLEEVKAMQQFEIADTLKITTIKPSDVDFYDNEGKKILENYQDLKNGLEAAQRKDEIEQKQAISKQDLNMHTTKVQLLTVLFSVLGLDVETGKGCYSNKKALKVRNAIRQDASLSRYVLLKLSLSVNSSLSDVALINKILKKLLGLKSDRFLVREGSERTWVYTVNSSFEPLIKYVSQAKNEENAKVCHQK